MDYTNDGNLDLTLTGFQISDYFGGRGTGFYKWENGVFVEDLESEINLDNNKAYSNDKADSSQKFIDWSKIPKFLFLPIPPIPLVLIVFMIIHGNSSARALIISLTILSLLFGLLFSNLLTIASIEFL